MPILTLYHGSVNIIERPAFGLGKVYNDYGQGFYCTEHIELAKEWACTEGVDGYANKYELATDDLNILNLLSEEYSILNWLALLMKNRVTRLSTPVSERGRDYLIENFLPDITGYDVISGYRADDSYFSFARAFVGNEISLKQLSMAMHLGKLGEQFTLKSKKAFDALSFVGYEVADNSIYYAKRKARDDEARGSYLTGLGTDDIDGIYMRDIIREDIKNGDILIR